MIRSRFLVWPTLVLFTSSTGLTKAQINSKDTSEQNAKYIVFDAPNDVDGLYVSSLNSTQTVVGSYIDANHVPHGFVRNPEGTIINVDIPEGTEVPSVVLHK